MPLGKEAAMNDGILKQTVKTHPFLRDMTPEQQQFISDSARVATFDPAQVIFQEGAPANECFFIHQGKVALEAEEPSSGKVVVQTLAPRKCSGGPG
jgi:CRP-like cAMP-binding protein